MHPTCSICGKPASSFATSISSGVKTENCYCPEHIPPEVEDFPVARLEIIDSTALPVRPAQGSALEALLVRHVKGGTRGQAGGRGA